ncbi:hypothetical protein pb186bvf_000139 [Paramecium bursaria]
MISKQKGNKKQKIIEDEDQIQKKVKLDDDQSVSQILEEEDIDIEEIEGLDVSEEEKQPIEDTNYIFIDKLPNQETALLKFQEQVRNRIKFYKLRYLQECYENQTKKSFVHDDAIPICADVRYLDFQKLHDSQLQIAGRLFDVIMMDPPWQLSSSQPSRGVAIAYSSLSDDMISKMPIQSLQDDGLILIWTINAKYKVTCKLMVNWGYKIVDEIVWVKKTVNGKIAKGHGFYLQHAKENCLVGVKGNLDWERCKKSVASDVIFSERRGQSQKPEEIYRYVEELIPNGILYFLKITSFYYIKKRALFGDFRKKKQYQEKLGNNRK